MWGEYVSAEALYDELAWLKIKKFKSLRMSQFLGVLIFFDYKPSFLNTVQWNSTLSYDDKTWNEKQETNKWVSSWIKFLAWKLKILKSVVISNFPPISIKKSNIRWHKKCQLHAEHLLRITQFPICPENLEFQGHLAFLIVKNLWQFPSLLKPQRRTQVVHKCSPPFLLWPYMLP